MERPHTTASPRPLRRSLLGAIIFMVIYLPLLPTASLGGERDQLHSRVFCSSYKEKSCPGSREKGASPCAMSQGAPSGCPPHAAFFWDLLDPGPDTEGQEMGRGGFQHPLAAGAAWVNGTKELPAPTLQLSPR